MNTLRLALVAAFFIAANPCTVAEEYDWKDIPAEQLEKVPDRHMYWFVNRCIAQYRPRSLEPHIDRARIELLKSDGEYVFLDVYSWIENSIGNLSVEAQEYLLKKIGEWIADDPDSVSARMMELATLHQLAWKHRGEDYYNQIPAERRRLFAETLERLTRKLNEHESIVDTDPYYHILTIRVLKLTGGDFDDMIESLEASNAIAPGNYAAFSSVAGAAMPRWSGSEDLINKAAEHFYLMTRNDFGLTFYFLVAHIVVDYVEPTRLIDDFNLEPADIVQGAIDAIDNEVFSPSIAMRDAARFALAANDKDLMLELLDTVGDRVPESHSIHPMLEVWRRWANNEDSGKKSQIHEYADLGAVPILQKSLDAGADVNAFDDEGRTPVIIAAQKNRWNAVKWLVENGADVNALDRNGRTAINYAATEKEWQSVKWLAEHGANPNLGPTFDGTPLVLAIYDKKPEIAIVLLEKGANPNRTYGAYWVPITSSIQAQLPEVLIAITKTPGANLDIGQTGGYTALLITAQTDQDELAKILLEAGANPNLREDGGNPPIHFAAMRDDIDLCNLLLEHDADPMIKNLNDQATLQVAARNDSPKIIEALIAVESVDVNAVDFNGETALHYAATYGFPNSVRALLKHPDIDVNTQSTISGITALHGAAYEVSMGCVRALLKAGADPTIKDHEGFTAADRAREKGAERIADMIEGN